VKALIGHMCARRSIGKNILSAMMDKRKTIEKYLLTLVEVFVLLWRLLIKQVDESFRVQTSHMIYIETESRMLQRKKNASGLENESVSEPKHSLYS
jgi:hypothetical protein